MLGAAILRWTPSGYIERKPIDVGGPEPLAFDLVTAREGLHLAAFGLLIPEVDRDQVCLYRRSGRSGRLGLTHGPTVHRGHAIRG